MVGVGHIMGMACLGKASHPKPRIASLSHNALNDKQCKGKATHGSRPHLGHGARQGKPRHLKPPIASLCRNALNGCDLPRQGKHAACRLHASHDMTRFEKFCQYFHHVARTLHARHGMTRFQKLCPHFQQASCMMRVGCVQGQACQASNSLTFSECLEWGAMPRPRPDMPTQGKPRHPKASLSRNVLNGEQCQGQAKARHAKAKQGKACQGQGMPRPRHAKDTTCQGQGTTCQRKNFSLSLSLSLSLSRVRTAAPPPFETAATIFPSPLLPHATVLGGTGPKRTGPPPTSHSNQPQPLELPVLAGN
ncbi:unnamed protein product [Prunus armeniaca]|uniref:Uncharacterized protein n=1 Tax=Prunus armeniaca TaxID=36596 RepID=A0A6J5X8L2_PRUAR|nr:unnamed protein product [Prunus armeniaca]